MADNFARLALKPAIAGGFLDRRFTAVLCYLQQEIAIRLLPYHDLIFIGIPFTANVVLGQSLLEASSEAYVSSDYLAIPHEVDHYLYQYGQPAAQEEKPTDAQAASSLGKYIQGQVQQALAQQTGRLQRSHWVFTWLEEIFADAYGCLVAGPVSVLGFIDVLANGRPFYLQAQPETHPVPVLRPLIQTQILRTMLDQAGNPLYGAEAALLDAHWRQWVKAHWSSWVDAHWPYGYGDQTDILRAAIYELAGQAITGEAILAELQVAIDVILRVLNPLRPLNTASTWTPTWVRQQYADEQQITGLFSHFQHFAVAEGLLAFAENLPVEESVGNQTSDQQAITGAQFPWLAAQLARLQRQRFVKPGFDTLVETLLFEGWSTEGPRGGSVH